MKISDKLKQQLRRFYNYWRYDFKEMAFPSSLPDPPGAKVRRKATWDDHVMAWKMATRIYLKSWKTHDIDIDEEFELAKNPNKKQEKKKKEESRESSVLEDLAVAAKFGPEHFREVAQKAYTDKLAVFGDTMKKFMEGYQEGLNEALNSGKSSQSAVNGVFEAEISSQDKSDESHVIRKANVSEFKGGSSVEASKSSKTDDLDEVKHSNTGSQGMINENIKEVACKDKREGSSKDGK